MRELAVQARNATNTNADKDSLDKEFGELAKEVQRVLGATTFNGKHVLGSEAGSMQFQVGANANQTLETRVGVISLGALGLRNTLDVTVSPAQAIVAVDRALDYVSSQRAVLGAQASRLEIFRALVVAGTEGMTLEDTFIRLTSAEPVAA